ncbi:hypothetical protein MASR2M78_24520 [Treponema sp.]
MDNSTESSVLHIEGKREASEEAGYGLPLIKGTHHFQVFRANREQPEAASGLSWTYNHAPMLVR